MNDERIHPPGRCTDPYYGNGWCSGIGYMAPDPFQEEINNDSSDYFMCDGERAGAAADI